MAKSDPGRLDAIGAALNRRETDFLTSGAAASDQARRRKAEDRLRADYRQAFSLDVDRIMHSLAYTRYIDKTQVFYLIQNDHITHRVLHVQLVSKIARTIGRFLGLNEDLIEASALGHDIGHAPFGHDGERFLSDLCRDAGIGHFYHSVQSVHFLDSVERKGKGWNLCLQTLDGILCHDGEIHNRTLRPDREKTFDRLDNEQTAKKTDPGVKLVPMTLEGCVVRFADTISYIGRDIEDAIRLGLLARTDLPADSVRILGDTNGTIVYTLVTDIIRQSYGQPHIAFSPDVSEALRGLKRFNLERIYMNAAIKRHTDAIRRLFAALFDRFLNDIEKENRTSPIFAGFLDGMSDAYLTAHRPPEIVRDFIAGMTDQFFLKQCPAPLVADLGLS